MPIKTEQRWNLSRPALEQLLQRLSSEPQQAAREYDVIRGKLIGFFERRGVESADTVADETIDRVARRLEEGQVIQHLDAYIYGVAKRVLLEWRKRRAQERSAEHEYPLPEPAAAAERREIRVTCLVRCLRRLPRDNRALIVGYYRGDMKERKRLAASFGITYANLRTRVCRLRVQLEQCLRECLEAPSLR